MNHFAVENIEELAKQAAGNHRKFTSFGWSSRPDDDENWAIVYVKNRDSRLLEESNAEAIEKEMEPFVEAGEVVPERHNHWACGWVDGYVIRVYHPSGEITAAFRHWCELQEKLSDYPVLDDEDYSRKEYDATVENITQAGRRFLKDEVPDDWAEQLFSWFWENDQGAVENRDDQGGYPSDEQVKDGLAAMGWLDDEYIGEAD